MGRLLDIAGLDSLGMIIFSVLLCLGAFVIPVFCLNMFLLAVVDTFRKIKQNENDTRRKTKRPSMKLRENAEYENESKELKFKERQCM